MNLFLGILAAPLKCLRLGQSDGVHRDSVRMGETSPKQLSHVLGVEG